MKIIESWKDSQTETWLGKFKTFLIFTHIIIKHQTDTLLLTIVIVMNIMLFCIMPKNKLIISWDST